MKGKGREGEEKGVEVGGGGGGVREDSAFWEHTVSPVLGFGVVGCGGWF